MTIKVPIEVLALQDEEGNPIQPEAGEDVAITLTGKLSGLEGGTATVEAVSANGVDLDEAGDGEDPVEREQGGDPQGETPASDDEAKAKLIAAMDETYGKNGPMA